MNLPDQNLPDQILEEFRKSSIPDRLTLINVEYHEGRNALHDFNPADRECFHDDKWYWTKWAEKNDQAKAISSGCWIARGCDEEGRRSGTVAYAKPLEPRKYVDGGKIKSIKYETPPKAEALPIVPWVDDETAQSIYSRYGVEPLEGETFWQVVFRCNLPIAITEGLKKALSLIAHGLPAIALRGIACWHKKGDVARLHEAIEHFATKNREIYIVFDQDVKEATVRDVKRQILKLSEQLESRQSLVKVLTWDPEDGKGIDDALYGLEDEAQTWLDELVQNAQTTKQFKLDRRVYAASNAIAKLNNLSYPVERATKGEYLPGLPPMQQGEIRVVSAGMCSGKTTRIGEDLVKPAISQGIHVLIFTPINNLGRQIAKNLGIPHIHQFEKTDKGERALWDAVANQKGLVCCPDSLLRIPQWLRGKPLLIVMDEANQLVKGIVDGNTLKNKQSETLELLTEVLQQAGKTGGIVLSEDGIPDRAVEFVQALSVVETVRVFKHERKATPWECHVAITRVSGYRRALLQAARSQRLLYVTTSQQEARRVESALSGPDKKIVRIDSETNEKGQFVEFFENPDQWLKDNQPDVLILSPSAKSGVSIEGGVSVEDAYFQAVWGYFPALDTDTQMQLLGRYRPAVPRIIFCPEFILGSGDESLLYPRAIKRRLRKTTRDLAGAGVYDLDVLLEASDDRGELVATIENAVLDYYAKSAAVAGSQKSLAARSLVCRLKQSGHSVEFLELERDKDTAELWKEIQDEWDRHDALQIASTIVNPKHDEEWAFRTLESMEASLESRTEARKILFRAEFPGVLFDDKQECYEALCIDHGAMRRGVLLQARAENLEAVKIGDRESAETIANRKIRIFHRLPKKLHRAALIAKTSILNLLDGTTYNNTDPRAIAVKKAALHWAEEIGYWLRLQIHEAQTPVEIVNKLLKKLGLEGKAVSRKGKRGEQRDREYQVIGLENPVRMRLLEAARRKLSESVSTICKHESNHLQIVDTSPPDLREWLTPESLADVLEMWNSADSEESRAEIRQFVPAEVLRRAIA